LSWDYIISVVGRDVLCAAARHRFEKDATLARTRRRFSRRERAEKKRRNQELETIFVRGKLKRVRRPPQIAGVDVDEFIRNNADPAWLHQNEMWECLYELEGNPQSAEPEFATGYDEIEPLFGELDAF
jgi:hypothetical protein